MEYQFLKGQRVEFEGFGEGTVVENAAGEEVEVAFSELETMWLPASQLRRV